MSQKPNLETPPEKPTPEVEEIDTDYEPTEAELDRLNSWSPPMRIDSIEAYRKAKMRD